MKYIILILSSLFLFTACSSEPTHTEEVEEKEYREIFDEYMTDAEYEREFEKAKKRYQEMNFTHSEELILINDDFSEIEEDIDLTEEEKEEIKQRISDGEDLEDIIEAYR